MADIGPPPADMSGFLLWMVSILAAALGAMWKLGESKNARDIKTAAEQVTLLRAENAGIKAELQTEIRILREDHKLTEEARLQCEMDRARLDAECKGMKFRIENLEARNIRHDT